MDTLSITKWWVNAAFPSHHNYRDQSDGMMSLDAGAVISGSRKQRINGKISTDNELIGTDDFMGTVLKTPYTSWKHKTMM